MDKTDQIKDLFFLLKHFSLRLVLSESCTGGLAAANLVGTEGASQYLCGSFVTYRPSAKRQWLDVKKETIEEHTCESMDVVTEMALSALSKTDEANISAAIVGDISSSKENIIYIAVCMEENQFLQQHRLYLFADSREARQSEAVLRLYELICDAIRFNERKNESS